MCLKWRARSVLVSLCMTKTATQKSEEVLFLRLSCKIPLMCGVATLQGLRLTYVHVHVTVPKTSQSQKQERCLDAGTGYGETEHS